MIGLMAVTYRKIYAKLNEYPVCDKTVFNTSLYTDTISSMGVVGWVVREHHGAI